jgi:hypothetical protein
MAEGIDLFLDVEDCIGVGLGLGVCGRGGGGGDGGDGLGTEARYPRGVSAAQSVPRRCRIVSPARLQRSQAHPGHRLAHPTNTKRVVRLRRKAGR